MIGEMKVIKKKKMGKQRFVIEIIKIYLYIYMLLRKNYNLI